MIRIESCTLNRVARRLSGHKQWTIGFEYDGDYFFAIYSEKHKVEGIQSENGAKVRNMQLENELAQYIANNPETTIHPPVPIKNLPDALLMRALTHWITSWKTVESRAGEEISIAAFLDFAKYADLGGSIGEERAMNETELDVLKTFLEQHAKYTNLN